MASPALPITPIPGTQVIALTLEHEALLQSFFEANPEYFFEISGQAAEPADALDELRGELPAGWPYSDKFVIGIVGERGSLLAMASMVSDLLARGVWHIGTFIVETARHGSGDAHVIYRGLERWAVHNGASWLRLGVVAGNTRAERFWERVGFTQTRLRPDVEFGPLKKTLRVMFKPLAGGTLADYLALDERDRPESASPRDSDEQFDSRR